MVSLWCRAGILVLHKGHAATRGRLEEAMSKLCKLLCTKWRRDQTEPNTTALVRQQSDEADLYDADAAGESYFGEISTFAEVATRTKRRHSSSLQKVIIVRPYFGPYAGRSVTFATVQSRTVVFVDAERVTTQLDLSSCRGRPRMSVRDQCIQFVHDDSRCQYDLPLPQPHSLKFLCKRHIHLSGVLPPGMPLSEAKKFDSTKQAVVVRVWPSDVLSRFRQQRDQERQQQELRGGQQAAANCIKLRVPVHISISELSYYARDKLSLPSTCSLYLREPDGIIELQPSRPLLQRHTALECFVRTDPPRAQPFTSLRASLRLPVMLVGSGMDDVVVSPTTTVVELEHAVTEKFGLSRSTDSFLYIPALLSHQGLQMYMNASRRSAQTLLNRNARHFPIVSDNDPHMAVDHRELPLYNHTIREAGLLEDRAPLICFEVTGPTVPLSFKAMCHAGSSGHSGSSSSSGATDSTYYSNYMIVTVETRIVSINPSWTAATLLKYIDCVSHFSCRQLLLNGSVIAATDKIGCWFDRQWLVQSPNGRRAISPNVLRAI